ncbi:hypothetical protein L9F63_009145 [Diploptera punctata]|uniref:Uncharacterized protein n=1 Tax=Diploptera punctata TaxID=6984 RepID=A0AAD7Z292_DIPPU|nr:hypothetical protein L9F63_009145 [Diploptera punctata]
MSDTHDPLGSQNSHKKEAHKMETKWKGNKSDSYSTLQNVQDDKKQKASTENKQKTSLVHNSLQPTRIVIDRSRGAIKKQYTSSQSNGNISMTSQNDLSSKFSRLSINNSQVHHAKYGEFVRGKPRGRKFVSKPIGGSLNIQKNADKGDNRIPQGMCHMKHSNKSAAQSNISNLSEVSSLQTPPNNFREINLLPTIDDIFRDEETFVRPNLIRGAYTNIEHYLDVQFRLLHEDFVCPLREGIREYFGKSARLKANKIRRISNIRLYKKSNISSSNCDK